MHRVGNMSCFRSWCILATLPEAITMHTSSKCCDELVHTSHAFATCVLCNTHHTSPSPAFLVLTYSTLTQVSQFSFVNNWRRSLKETQSTDPNLASFFPHSPPASGKEDCCFVYASSPMPVQFWYHNITTTTINLCLTGLTLSLCT